MMDKAKIEAMETLLAVENRLAEAKIEVSCVMTVKEITPTGKKITFTYKKTPLLEAVDMMLRLDDV